MLVNETQPGSAGRTQDGGLVECPGSESREWGAPLCDFPETSYGIVKRVRVFSKWIDDFKRREGLQTASILDYGCGTGSALTCHLGRAGDAVLGIDSHGPSVEAALRENRFPNVTYMVADLSDLLNREKRFDVIVCSEVLEHLEGAESYLQGFAKLLDSSGILIISVPNGFGPFELLRRIEQEVNRLRITRVFGSLRKLGRRILRSFLKPRPEHAALSLNSDSEHINFFRLPELEILCRDAGFQFVEVRGRSLVCGPYADFWLNRGPFQVLRSVNNTLADWLPLRFCSDWMVLLKKKRNGC